MPAESDMVHNHDFDPSCTERWVRVGPGIQRLKGACLAPSEPRRNDLESPSSMSVDHSPTDDAKGPQISDTDWANERTDVLVRFMVELQRATGDGSRKRQAGTKPPWYEDDSHEGAILSHLTKWKRGELVDPDSGAHPLVHAAWRCLAIACRETGNTP